MEYSSNGKGNLGVTLGAIGTGLGVLNNGNGLFGGLTGGNQNYVTNEMLDLQMRLAKSERDNAILTADLSSEKKMVEVFNAAVERDNKIRDEIADLRKEVHDNAASQAVINCGFNSNIAVINSQVNQLFSLAKLVIPSTSVCTASTTTTT